MLKLKLQYFGHLMWRNDSLEKTLMLGKIEGRRRGGQQRMIWLNGITKSMDMTLCKLREILKDKETWHATVHGVTRNWTRLSNWTTIKSFTWGDDWNLYLILKRKTNGTKYIIRRGYLFKDRPELINGHPRARSYLKFLFLVYNMVHTVVFLKI